MHVRPRTMHAPVFVCWNVPNEVSDKLLQRWWLSNLARQSWIDPYLKWSSSFNKVENGLENRVVWYLKTCNWILYERRLSPNLATTLLRRTPSTSCVSWITRNQTLLRGLNLPVWWFRYNTSCNEGSCGISLHWGSWTIIPHHSSHHSSWTSWEWLIQLVRTCCCGWYQWIFERF